MKNETKKVRLTLVGLDGNAFALMGAFKAAARRQGFDQKWTNDILNEAMQGDYNHLLMVLTDNTESEDADDENEFELEDAA